MVAFPPNAGTMVGGVGPRPICHGSLRRSAGLPLIPNLPDPNVQPPQRGRHQGGRVGF
jgi:hypothetical protein